VISLENVRVRYGMAVALDDVTERAADGEWLCVIGPNGAGKTTLLQAVARQVRHDGRIEVCGQPTAGMSRRKLARLVAYVPQRPQLPPDMTVGDYVLLGRTPHIGYLRVETDADRQISAELIDRLALSALAGRELRTLSGGELQRLVLARALAQQAPVLVLDEPTSALDLGRRVDALELVDAARQERSLTVLSAVHDLTLAGQFADRLLLLDGGRVAASGPPPDVLRDDVLRPHFGPGVEVLTTGRGDRAVISRRPPRGAAPPRADRVRLPRPLPPRHLAQRMQLIVGLGVGVLHRHVRPELHVRAQRLAERGVIGQPGRVGGGQVQLDEPLPLLLGDLQAAVHVDEMGEAQLPGEVVGAPERFGLERGQVVDVIRLARAEQRLQQGIGEHAAIEDVDEAVQAVVAARVLVDRFHNYSITGMGVALNPLPGGRDARRRALGR